MGTRRVFTFALATSAPDDCNEGATAVGITGRALCLIMCTGPKAQDERSVALFIQG